MLFQTPVWSCNDMLAVCVFLCTFFLLYLSLPSLTSFSFSIYLSLPSLFISFHFLSTSSVSIYLSIHSLSSFSFFIYMFLLYLTLHSLSDVLYVPLSRLSIFSSSSIYTSSSSIFFLFPSLSSPFQWRNVFDLLDPDPLVRCTDPDPGVYP